MAKKYTILNSMSFTPGINKIKWQLILIPSIAFITSAVKGILQSSQKIGFQFPVQLFFILGIFIFVIWEVNMFVYRKLDRQIPFFQNPQNRFIKQVIFGFIATFATFSVIYLLMGWLLNSPFRLPLFFKYLVVASAISFLINSLYIYQYLQKSIYYREEIKTKELNDLWERLQNQKPIAPLTNVQPAEIKSILIEAGNKTYPIPFEKIAYFISGEGIVTLVETNGQKLTTNYNSYSQISNRLPGQLFFQLNRQFITHLQSIRSVSDDKNRKLLVLISAVQSSSNQELVVVSRYRNPEFKQWFSENLSY